MQEILMNERRNWKAQVFPYDHFIPDNSPECLYCLTDNQAEILRGIIEPLAWHTRWWSDTDTPIDKDAIEAFRDDLTRRLMMSCCGDEIPVQYRYTTDGVLQRSEDGGSTWTDAPEYDPRNYSPQFPPMSGDDGDDKKCLAATGAVALIKEQVGDQLTDDMTRYTLAQLITDWVKTYLETSNPFLTLLTVIANQIFALIIAVLRPALTDAVYATLKCALYCHMGEDASFSIAQWQAVRNDITSQIGGIAGVFLEHLVYLLGAGGLTNLARAGGAASGDCFDCGCGADCVSAAWEIYDDGRSGGVWGVELSRTADTITVQAANLGPFIGGYGAGIRKIDLSTLCQIDWEVLSGHTTGVLGSQTPGSIPLDGSGNPNNMPNPPANYNCVCPVSTVPFTVRFTISDPP